MDINYIIILLWILELPRLLEEVELEALIPEVNIFIYNLQTFLTDILHKLKYTHLESFKKTHSGNIR